MGIVFKKIFNGGVQSRPFKAHKRYEVTNVNHSSSFEISVLRGISDNGILTEVSTSVSGEIGVDTFLTSSGGVTRELNSIPQKIIWNSINSTFFKRRSDIRLYDTASVVSIPQNKFGNGIKPKSVSVSDNSDYPNSTISLSDQVVDTEYGLLIASELTSSTFIKSSDVVLNLSLDGEFKDYSSYDNRVIDGKYTFGESGANIGKVVNLTDQTQSIRVRHNSNFNVLNKNDNWSVSFWANIPLSQSISGRSIFNLIQKRNAYTYIDDANNEQVKSDGTGQYPFDLSFYSEEHPTLTGQLFLRASDGKSTINISSSMAYNDGEFHHYTINKSGDEIGLYVDGTKEVSASYSFRGNVNNDRDILIGSRDVKNSEANFSGSIGQLRVHRTGLTDNEISSLADNSSSGSALQKKEVGYVFYKQGMIITTDPRPRYQNIFLGNGDWGYTDRDYELNYRATKQIEEVSILCEIKRNEYNVSSNPSLRIDSTDTDPRLQNMVTGSDFRPYITQIGLYNDTGDLLAVGKLGSPLKKRRDVDVTVNVKFDID
jgi:hypothetical protein